MSTHCESRTPDIASAPARWNHHTAPGDRPALCPRDAEAGRRPSGSALTPIRPRACGFASRRAGPEADVCRAAIDTRPGRSRRWLALLSSAMAALTTMSRCFDLGPSSSVARRPWSGYSVGEEPASEQARCRELVYPRLTDPGLRIAEIDGTAVGASVIVNTHQILSDRSLSPRHTCSFSSAIATTQATVLAWSWSPAQPLTPERLAQSDCGWIAGQEPATLWSGMNARASSGQTPSRLMYGVAGAARYSKWSYEPVRATRDPALRRP